MVGTPLNSREQEMRHDDRSRKMCKLDDGTIVRYDGCTTREPPSDFYTPDGWEYIGCGTIYSVNDVLVSSSQRYWFYVRK